MHAALASRHRSIVSPDTGSLRGDLLELMSAVVRGSADVTPDIVWGLLTESADDGTLAATVRYDLVDVLPEQLAATVVARAEERGELAPRPRPAREVTLPFDLIRSEFFARGRVDPDAIEEILDQVALPLLRQTSGAC